MFIRQFSLRWLLIFTALCAVISLVIALAVEDHRWATCIVGGLISWIVVMLVYAIAFSGVWWISRIWEDYRGPRPNTEAPNRDSVATPELEGP